MQNDGDFLGVILLYRVLCCSAHACSTDRSAEPIARIWKSTAGGIFSQLVSLLNKSSCSGEMTAFVSEGTPAKIGRINGVSLKLKHA